MGPRTELGQGLSRRELMKRGMRTGAYVAPIVLTSIAVAPVAAQTVSRPTATPTPLAPTALTNGAASASVPFGLSFTITGANYTANTTVYVVLQNTATGLFTFVPVTSSATGTITTTFNPQTNTFLAANGPGSFTVLTTYTMPTTAVAGQLASASLTITPLVTMQPVPFFQDFSLTGAAPNTTYNVFYRPSNTPVTFTQAPATITTDPFGVGGVVYPVSVDTSAVTSILEVATIPGQPASTPTNPAASFTSNIVTVLASANGAPRAVAVLSSQVIQEQTTAGGGQFTDYVDVGIFNQIPNTQFDIYIQPNGTGAFTKVATVTTNSAGNITVFTPITMTGAAATSFVVNAVLTGMPATPPVLTRTVSGANLINIAFTPMVVAADVASFKPQAHALQH